MLKSHHRTKQPQELIFNLALTNVVSGIQG